MTDRELQVLAQFEIRVFKIPPCQDVIVIGRRAPIGKHAVEIMLETVAPGIFQVVELEHPTIESLVVKKGHINLIGKESLISLIIKEIKGLMDDTAVLNIGLDICLTKNITVNLESNGN